MNKPLARKYGKAKAALMKLKGRSKYNRRIATNRTLKFLNSIGNGKIDNIAVNKIDSGRIFIEQLFK